MVGSTVRGELVKASLSKKPATWKRKLKSNFGLSQHAKSYVCVSRAASCLLKLVKLTAQTQARRGWVSDGARLVSPLAARRTARPEGETQNRE